MDQSVQSVASSEAVSSGNQNAWHRQKRQNRKQLWRLLSTALPMILLALFAYSHIVTWMETGHPTGIIFAAQEALLIVLFLIRRDSLESSNTPMNWIVATLGSWGLLLLRPTGASVLGLDSLYLGLQGAGLVLAILGALSLGRSFGIVAANRGVKIHGMYRVVRHPIYAAYMVSYLGYLLSSLSIVNALVIVVVTVAQVRRIRAEELVLLRDSDYREYADSVRYRLIPGVY